MPGKNKIRVQNLSRFMVYILGHCPYEFGLMPNGSGYIPVRELLQAIHEEHVWSYVSQGSINEVLMSEERHLFETAENMIRAVTRHWQLDMDLPADNVPSLLFTPVRRKAHYHAIDKGLTERGDKPYVLSSDKSMAERIGRRKDQKPVIIEVMARRAKDKGILFYSFGDLFLAHEIPLEYIAGPPVPKDFIREKEEKPQKKKEVLIDFSAGTFPLDITGRKDSYRGKKGQKKKGWKEESRKMRRRG